MDGEEKGGHLLHNLLLFGRLLRRLGLDVTPARMVDLVHALQHVNVGNRDDFYFTLRSLLVQRHEDLPLFDRAFELFWKRRSEIESDLGKITTERAQEVLTAPPGATATTNGEPDEKEIEQMVLEITKTYSQQERLRQKDFADLTPEETEDVRRLIQELAWKLGQRRTRRFRPGRGARPDLRRSLRRNLRYGGEMLVLPRRRRKQQPRPLVVIADVSGSMERYTELLLLFVHSLSAELTQHVESFVFSTRLTRITHQLRNGNLDRALHDVSHSVHDWSGGTRIGQALRTFNYRWGRRVLNRGAVVLLISDGWDRGDPELLGKEVARLQRTCYRLIWLNPLLGSQRYEPLTRGLQAALPYVDDFLPVHNLASLEELAEHLAQLSGQRDRNRTIRTIGSAFIGR